MYQQLFNEVDPAALRPSKNFNMPFADDSDKETAAFPRLSGSPDSNLLKQSIHSPDSNMQVLKQSLVSEEDIARNIALLAKSITENNALIAKSVSSDDFQANSMHQAYLHLSPKTPALAEPT